MKTHTDVLIIGGGVIGAAIAYYTSRSGFDVTVIEKKELASGTSSRCDGNILAIDKDPGFDSEMSLQSQKLVHELSTELEFEFEYRAPGSILVCETDEEMIAAEKWVERQNNTGVPMRMLDRTDLQQDSNYFADDLLGGLECPSDSTVNPYLMTYSLFDGAQKNGTTVITNTEVLTIKKSNHYGDFQVSTTNGEFTAKKVIDACGIWAPKIAQMVDIEIPIVPRKGHIIVASRNIPIGLRKVMEFGYLLSKFGGKRKVDEETEQYGVALVFEPTTSQNFLIGSSRQFVGFDTKVDMDVVQCIARRAVRFYPKLKEMNFIRAYAGLRPWTPDHLPIISHVDEVPGFYIAAGHEGDGISLAAITGKLMAEMIEGREQTVIPTEPLRYNRFNRAYTAKS
jgi:glycine/D-amino acid oxidase-like deaminating enzyme